MFELHTAIVNVQFFFGGGGFTPGYPTTNRRQRNLLIEKGRAQKIDGTSVLLLLPLDACYMYTILDFVVVVATSSDAA